MMGKPMKTLEMHYPMIQFSIKRVIHFQILGKLFLSANKRFPLAFSEFVFMEIVSIAKLSKKENFLLEPLAHLLKQISTKNF